MVIGAEAEVKRNGGEIEKIRVRKGYRIVKLDESIRKRRTITEARLLSEARRSGVSAPNVIDTGEFSIRMEYINGKTVRDSINDGNCEEVSFLIAESAAKLHNAGIIHGDLTTSNMIFRGVVYIIDFGLGFRSQKVEDKATDLYLLKEALESTHFSISRKAWKTILKVYRVKSKDGAKVLTALEKIEKRSRDSEG